MSSVAMPLTPGQTIGPYAIVAKLGEGGMGEVYRARDTSLGRDVAIKVLPEAVSQETDRLMRFEREARTLAALNHPQIAQIYGVERNGGTTALVLELVEGPTLADRIRSGRIPVDEALAIASQIADALEAAHQQGIIHRDLKPANIKVKSDGTVKVLDFGLAKALDPIGGSAAGVSESATVTSPAMTHIGMILGTAAYMSPEQARGRPVDRRADIWAFGCVLYEMLTGRRPFDAEDVSLTLSKVLQHEPDFNALPADTPPHARRAIEVCLRKDPKRRAHDIADVRLVLEGAFGTAAPGATPVASGRPVRWRSTVALIGAVGAGALVAGMGVWTAVTRPVVPRLSRLQIVPPSAAAPLISGFIGNLTIAPDGSRIVYAGIDGTLFMRALDQLEVVPIAAAAAARSPAVSPDGQWVTFADAFPSLKRVAITGGPVTLLCRADGAVRGTTWGAGDVVVYATDNPATGLQQTRADGSEPVTLTKPDPAQGETDHVFPEFLPGGQAVLFTITSAAGGSAASRVAVFDLRTRTQTVLIRGGTHARYVPSGHLIYALGGTLMAVAFDLATRGVIGQSVPILSDVHTTPTGAMYATVANDGTLVYIPGAAIGNTRQLVWVDRQGREVPVPAPMRAYAHVRLSPDGTRVAAFLNDQEQDLWLWEFARPMLSRVTSSPTIDTYPVWAADGRRLYFSSNRLGQRNIFAQAADTTGDVERLTESPNRQDVTSLSPDGQWLAFTDYPPDRASDILQVSLDKARTIVPLVRTPFAERNGAISPDGRWLAYEANDSGRYEIYVQPYPDVGRGRWPVGVGTRPVWARNTHELFYLAPDGALMRGGVSSGPAWTATAQVKVLEPKYFRGDDTIVGRTYDVASDGLRFLMIQDAPADKAAGPGGFVVVHHFDEELKRRVPRP